MRYNVFFNIFCKECLSLFSSPNKMNSYFNISHLILHCWAKAQVLVMHNPSPKGQGK